MDKLEKDELKIMSKGMKDFVSKFISGQLRKKFGYDVDIQLGNVMVTQDDNIAHMDLTVSANISMCELMKILKANDLV